jgi:multidrug transporter EmrE-like cation transporter
MDFILAIVTIESLGDWSFTKFVEQGRKHVWYKVLGYVCYVGLLELFQKTIETKGLSWANSAWDGYSNIATGLVAILLFKEKPTWTQLIGMILISIGIMFLGTDGVVNYKEKNAKA